MSRSDAARKGDAVARMVDSDGWDVLMELIDSCQRHEQKMLMKGPARGEDQTYERIIGQWAGMDRIPMLAEGMIRYGKQAAQEMDATPKAA